jgi:predicted small lipoprotein YifL
MTRTLVITLAAALVLCACGKRGDLERPEPMWAPAQVDRSAPGR